MCGQIEVSSAGGGPLGSPGGGLQADTQDGLVYPRPAVVFSRKHLSYSSETNSQLEVAIREQQDLVRVSRGCCVRIDAPARLVRVAHIRGASHARDGGLQRGFWLLREHWVRGPSARLKFE